MWRKENIQVVDWFPKTRIINKGTLKVIYRKIPDIKDWYLREINSFICILRTEVNEVL